MSLVSTVFKECVHAIRDGELIERESHHDKEFHFQNWFQERLQRIGENFDVPGRNAYPDFRLVHHAEGYEKENELNATLVANPDAGREHVFRAYRVAGDPLEPVILRERSRQIAEQKYSEETT